MASAYDDRPWLALYNAGMPADIVPAFGDALSIFRAAVARAPVAPAIHYFDATLTYGDLDRHSDAFAGWLRRGPSSSA